MNTHWIRILGSVLIALGIGTFIASVLAGIAYYIYTMFQAQDYLTGIALTSSMLIATGWTLRRVFRETPKKI
jgi:Na+/proline symporter